MKSSQKLEAGRKTYEIQQQFMRWVNSGGRFLGGLYSPPASGRPPVGQNKKIFSQLN